MARKHKSPFHKYETVFCLWLPNSNQTLCAREFLSGANGWVTLRYGHMVNCKECLELMKGRGKNEDL